MSLSSIQLDAFLAVARKSSFSTAAKKLHITQSALSQRILNLEADLGSTLFIRNPSGLRLTDLGQQLLRYCQTKEGLEEEVLSQVAARDHQRLAGIVRIGSFSTVTRSVVIPVLRELLIKHQLIQAEIMTRELRELPALLESGQAEYILLTRHIERQGVVNHLLGYEENVLVQPKHGRVREDVYLDHDQEDTTTEEFFRLQPSRRPAKIRRSFLDEIYSIIDGVMAGLGRAVIPLHIAKKVSGLEVMKGYKSLKVPVYLVYFEQAFYTKLQSKVLECLRTQAPSLL